MSKKKRIIKCDKITVKCDIGTAQCDDGTVKCEKKNRVPPNVTKVQSEMILVLPNVITEGERCKTASAQYRSFIVK